MIFKIMKLKTAVVLIDRALEIADTVNEDVLGAHLAHALHIAEQRIQKLESEL